MVSYQKCSDGGQLSPWRDVRAVEGTGLENRRRASVRGFESHSLRHFFKFICYLQKYPRGRRGSPAKGVGWLKPARGFKSLLLRQSPQAQAACGGFLYFGADVVINVRGTSEEERIALIKKETHGRARISSANAWAVPRHSRRGCGTCARPVCIWSRVTSWNAVKRPKSACMRSAPTTCASSA